MKQRNVDNEQQQKLYKSILLLMDSMTEEELKSNDISIIERNESRQNRICRGSGVDKIWMEQLIRIYKQFKATFKSSGLSGKKMNKFVKIKIVHNN